MKSTTDPKITVAVQCIAAALLLWATKIMVMPMIVRWQQDSSFLMQTGVLLAKMAIFLVPIAFLHTTKQGAPRCPTHPQSKRFWMCGGLLFPMMASAGMVSFGIQLVAEKMGTSGNQPSMPKPQSGLQMLIWIVSMVVLPAVAEELLFRKEIQQRLLIFGSKKAILLSALLFAAVHSNLVQVGNAFVGGMFLGIAAFTWGVNASILLHFINNLCALVLPWMGGRVTILFWGLSAAVSILYMLQKIFWKRERAEFD